MSMYCICVLTFKSKIFCNASTVCSLTQSFCIFRVAQAVKRQLIFTFNLSLRRHALLDSLLLSTASSALYHVLPGGEDGVLSDSVEQNCTFCNKACCWVQYQHLYPCDLFFQKYNFVSQVTKMYLLMRHLH